MGGKNDSNYNQVLYLRAMSPRESEPYFKVRKATDDDQWEDLDNQIWVSGYLISISIIDKEYEGMPYKVIRTKLEDDPGIMYIVDVRLDMAIGREFVNRLLGKPEFGSQMRITLFESDPGKGYDRGFSHIAVSFDKARPGSPVKYIGDKFKSMYEEYKMKGGKIGRDYAKQEAKLIAELEQVLAGHNFDQGQASPPPANQAPATPAKQAPAPPKQEPDTGIPGIDDQPEQEPRFDPEKEDDDLPF